MDRCLFCDEISFKKEMDKGNKDRLTKHSYTLAIVKNSKRKGVGNGRSVYFKRNGIGYPLNFCPECGSVVSDK